MPLSKVPKKDLGPHVSSTGMNLHEFLGTKIDDTNKHTQRCMHEHIGKHAKIQRNKESQTGWHKESKASISSHGVEKGMRRANQHHGDVYQ